MFSVTVLVPKFSPTTCTWRESDAPVSALGEFHASKCQHVFGEAQSPECLSLTVSLYSALQDTVDQRIQSLTLHVFFSLRLLFPWGFVKNPVAGQAKSCVQPSMFSVRRCEGQVSIVWWKLNQCLCWNYTLTFFSKKSIKYIRLPQF